MNMNRRDEQNKMTRVNPRLKPVAIAMTLISVAALALTTFCTAQADEDFDPQIVIEGRQANLRDLGGAFKNISDELKKSQPVLAVVRQYARQIDDLAKQQKFWYPHGSGPDSEIETAAKQEIWTQPKKFAEAQTAMTTAAASLLQVTAGNDVAAIRKQQQALGRTCKGCHDAFREEED
jgi:cytochrome c556